MKQRLLNFKMLLLICLLMAVGGENALAQDETLNFVGWNFSGAKDWTNSYEDRTISGDVISVDMNANKQANTVADCPVTRGKQIIVKLKDAETYTITGVELLLKQWTTKKQTVTLNVSNDGTNYTKKNSSSNFSLKADGLKVKFLKFTFSSTNQVGIKSIKVKYESASNPKTATTLTFPNESFSFATTDDLASFKGQTATLKAGETELTGKTIAYSKSGDDIFTSFDETTGALVLNGNAGTATVTAKFAGSDEYASSSESYTITVRKVYGNIAELKNVLTTTAKEYSLNLKDAVVTGIYDNEDNAKNVNVYIEDESAGILIFYPNANNNFKVGQKLNGEVTIKGKTYNSLPEITSWTATESYSAVDGADLPLTTVTIAELASNFSKYESRRVKIENATVTTGTTDAKESGKIAQGEYEMTLRTNAVAVTTTKDDVIDVIGYPTTYKTFQQLGVWSQDDIIVNSSVVKTTLSFDPATKEYNVDNNNKDAFTAPIATVKDAEGNVVEGAAITYTSSKPSVATVGETDGKLTFVGFGTTVITANYAGDATHMASSNSYTINYGKVKTTMSWSAPTATANLGETSFDAPTLTLKAGDTDILAGKTIKYSSSATNVAEISAEGSVKIKAEGTTVITATFAGDDTYAEASASYTLTVTDPNKPEEKSVTFDFMNPSKYGYGVSEGNDEIGKGAGDVIEGKTFVEGIVTWTNSIQAESTCTRFFGDGLRSYADNMHTISVPAGYRITSVSIVFGSKPSKNFTIGDADKNNATWTGDAKSVDIVYTGGTTKMEALIVNYKKLPVSEVTSGTINFIAHDAEGYRYATFSSDKDVVFTDDVVVSGVSITNGKLIVTDLTPVSYDVTDTEKGNVNGYYVPANTGVLVNCIAETATYYFPKTTQVVTLPANQLKPAPAKGGEFTPEDGYKYYKLAYDNYSARTGLGFYWGAENGGAFNVKAGTAYLAVPTSESNAKGFAFDGETTGIENVNVAANQNRTIYNLNGQRVSNMSQAGLYIVNGKKVVIRK